MLCKNDTKRELTAYIAFIISGHINMRSEVYEKYLFYYYILYCDGVR